MKRIIITTCLGALAFMAGAQTLDRQSVDVGGGEMSQSTLHIQYTIGDAFVGSFSTTNIDLNQGYNQSTNVGNVSTPVVDVPLQFSIYPNPTSDVLHVTTQQRLNVQVTDLLGHNIGSSVDVSSGLTGSLNVSNLSAGIYLLRVTAENGQATTYKWIKS
jgi:hypothetical protein